MYLLHGLYGSDDIFLANTSIQKFAEDAGIAVVIPCGENSFYLNHLKSHELYADYVGQELLDITRNIFPLSCKREDTFIAGFSMGGYGVIRNGLKYSHNFSKIGAVSAALITDDVHLLDENNNVLYSRSFAESCFGNLDEVIGSDVDPKYLIEHTKNIPEIFMACGYDDFLYDKNVDFYNFLHSKGVNSKFIQVLFSLFCVFLHKAPPERIPPFSAGALYDLPCYSLYEYRRKSEAKNPCQLFTRGKHR